MILISFVVSCIFIAILAGLSVSKPGKGLAVLACCACASLTFAPALLLQGLLTAPVAAYCLIRDSKPRTMLIGASVAMAVSYGAVFTLGLMRISQFRELREQYPLVSLSDRLAYERPAAKTPNVAEKQATPKLDDEVEAFLVDIEKRDSGSLRRDMLQVLHDGVYERFAMAQGFGPIRMLEFMPDKIEVKLPTLPAPGMIPYESPLPGSDVPAVETPDRDSLKLIHKMGLWDFLDEGRMGAIRDREHVAGFLSHAFSRVPEMPERETDKQTWQIARLELISLLRHKTPVAYVSKDLPNIEQLKDAVTRPLDKFETDSLDKLRTAEDLVIDERPQYIRMVGSVRAGKDCLHCHSVERGELLGAFSYELSPAVKSAFR